ncbi:MAG: PAS domain S-box protein, partial [Proteobacteria bacterium]|nr:PAS domain S-box protein [Pseudomonadota bacterium]
MKDTSKTNPELIEEISFLKQRIKELEQSESGRKQVEEALRESEEKYRSLFDNAVEGIFQTTSEGRFISANPALAKLFKYDSPQEYMEQITDIGRQHYVNPEDRETYKNTLEAEGVIKGLEVQLLNKDGNTVWASISAHAVRDNKGTVMYYAGTVEDITTRRQAEEEIIGGREKLKTLSDNAPFGMALVDKEGRFTYINARFTKLFGYDLSDIPDGRAW